MISPTQVLQSFISHAFPYKKHIIERNESFFLGDGCSIKQDYMSESIKLTELWKTRLSDSNKEVVWKYFQVMIVIAEKYINSTK